MTNTYVVQGTISHHFVTTVNAESEDDAQDKIESGNVTVTSADFTEEDDIPNVSSVKEV